MITGCSEETPLRSGNSKTRIQNKRKGFSEVGEDGTSIWIRQPSSKRKPGEIYYENLKSKKESFWEDEFLEKFQMSPFLFEIQKKIVKRTTSAIAHDALGAVGIPTMCAKPELKEKLSQKTPRLSDHDECDGKIKEERKPCSNKVMTDNQLQDSPGEEIVGEKDLGKSTVEINVRFERKGDKPDETLIQASPFSPLSEALVKNKFIMTAFFRNLKTDENLDLPSVFISDTRGFDINLGAFCGTLAGQTLFAKKIANVKVHPCQRKRRYERSDFKESKGTFFIHNAHRISYLYDKRKQFAVDYVGNETLLEALIKDGRFKEDQLNRITLFREKGKVTAGINHIASKYSSQEFSVLMERIPYLSKQGKLNANSSMDRERDLSDGLGHLEHTLTRICAKKKPGRKESEIEIFEEIEGRKVLREPVVKVVRERFQQVCQGHSGISMSIKQYRLIGQRERSVGCVYSVNQRGYIAYGTGFYLGRWRRKRYIMTNFHVMNDLQKMQGDSYIDFDYVDEGPNHQCAIKSVLISSNSSLDYAILEVDIPSNVPVPMALGPLLAEVPRLYHPIFFIGHPGQPGLTTINCPKRINIHCLIVDSEEELQNRCQEMGSSNFNLYREKVDPLNHCYQTVDFFKGSSGSPGFTDSGKLVLLHRQGVLCQETSRRYPNLFSMVEQGVSVMEIVNDAYNNGDENVKTIVQELFPSYQASRQSPRESPMEIDSPGPMNITSPIS